MKNRSNNKISKKTQEVIDAYKNEYTNIKSDVEGSYTGVPQDGEYPIQDVDDL